MGNDTYKFLGAGLMVFSGIFYTAERIAEKHAAALVAAGYASGGMGSDRTAQGVGFFDNFFVWFLFFVGFLLLAYGFPRHKD